MKRASFTKLEWMNIGKVPINYLKKTLHWMGLRRTPSETSESSKIKRSPTKNTKEVLQKECWTGDSLLK